MGMVTPEPLRWIVQTVNRLAEPLALQTTGQYFERHIKDARLRAVLASQWADYGVLPNRSAFVAHAVITEALLGLVEQHHPGFRDLVAYAELSAPLSFE